MKFMTYVILFMCFVFFRKFFRFRYPKLVRIFGAGYGTGSSVSGSFQGDQTRSTTVCLSAQERSSFYGIPLAQVLVLGFV